MRVGDETREESAGSERDARRNRRLYLAALRLDPNAPAEPESPKPAAKSPAAGNLELDFEDDFEDASPLPPPPEAGLTASREARNAAVTQKFAAPQFDSPTEPAEAPAPEKQRNTERTVRMDMREILGRSTPELSPQKTELFDAADLASARRGAAPRPAASDSEFLMLPDDGDFGVAAPVDRPGGGAPREQTGNTGGRLLSDDTDLSDLLARRDAPQDQADTSAQAPAKQARPPRQSTLDLSALGDADLPEYSDSMPEYDPVAGKARPAKAARQSSINLSDDASLPDDLSFETDSHPSVQGDSRGWDTELPESDTPHPDTTLDKLARDAQPAPENVFKGTPAAAGAATAAPAPRRAPATPTEEPPAKDAPGFKGSAPAAWGEAPESAPRPPRAKAGDDDDAPRPDTPSAKAASPGKPAVDPGMELMDDVTEAARRSAEMPALNLADFANKPMPDWPEDGTASAGATLPEDDISALIRDATDSENPIVDVAALPDMLPESAAALAKASSDADIPADLTNLASSADVVPAKKALPEKAAPASESKVADLAADSATDMLLLHNAPAAAPLDDGQISIDDLLKDLPQPNATTAQARQSGAPVAFVRLLAAVKDIRGGIERAAMLVIGVSLAIVLSLGIRENWRLYLTLLSALICTICTGIWIGAYMDEIVGVLPTE